MFEGLMLNQSWTPDGGGGGNCSFCDNTTLVYSCGSGGVESSGLYKVYSIDPPDNPNVGDVWISPSYTYVFDGFKFVRIDGEKGVDSTEERRCEYCGTKILNNNKTHCKSCGAPV